MVDIIVAIVGLTEWLVVTVLANIFTYGFITMGIANDWFVAFMLGFDVLLGMIGVALARALIKLVKEK